MKRQKRLVSAFLLVIVLLMTFTGCDDEEYSTENEPVVSAETEYVGSAAYQQWMTWLKAYDKWVDSYIQIAKKVDEDPWSAMDEYLSITAEAYEWSAKAAEIETDTDLTALETLRVYAEYQRILARQLKAMEEVLEETS